MKNLCKNKKNVIIAVVILAIIFGSFSSCQKKKAYDTKSKDELSFTEEDIPLPDGLSTKQELELMELYKAAYEDEKQALDIAVVDAINNFDEYGELKQEFKNALGTTEEFYQAINALDPNLKNVVADDVAYNYANSPLDYYLINQGVGTVLANNDTGKEIRSTIEEVGLALIECFTIWSLEESKTTRKDALMPVVYSDEYALVRSLGNINQIMDEIEVNSCYRIANKVFDEREQTLSSLNASLEEYWNTTGDELFKTWVKGENYHGRKKALENARQEWDNALYEWKSSFLNNLGIKDVDSLLKSDDDESTEKTESLNVSGNQYVYSIMDKQGKVYGSFLSFSSNVTAFINNDGMCSFTAGSEDAADNCTSHVIMDKNANILFQNDKEADADGNRTVYYDITPSGNVLKKTLKSDFDHGDYAVLEFVKPDGSTKTLMEGGTISLSRASKGWYSYNARFYDDYYQFSCGYEDDSNSWTSGIIDMTTGEIITGEQYEKITQNISDQKLAEMGVDVEMAALGEGEEDTTNPLTNGTRLNDDYVIYENVIYDNSANEVTTLDAGRGVKDILYANNHYWVVSKSGWYYVLDENFNQVLEPVEFGEDDIYRLTGYGLMISSQTTCTKKNIDGEDYTAQEQIFSLYDEKGNVTVELPGNLDLNDDAHGFIFGNEKVGWVNLNTKETMLITVSDGNIISLAF